MIMLKEQRISSRLIYNRVCEGSVDSIINIHSENDIPDELLNIMSIGIKTKFIEEVFLKSSVVPDTLYLAEDKVVNFTLIGYLEECTMEVRNQQDDKRLADYDTNHEYHRGHTDRRRPEHRELHNSNNEMYIKLSYHCAVMYADELVELSIEVKSI